MDWIWLSASVIVVWVAYEATKLKVAKIGEVGYAVLKVIGDDVSRA